jgi:hypothetical protein
MYDGIGNVMHVVLPYNTVHAQYSLGYVEEAASSI